MSERYREMFISAAAMHGKGDLDGAEAIYRQIHEDFPLNPDALHMLGIVAIQRGDNHAAAGFIMHAIDINPLNADFHVNLAAVWRALGCYRLLKEAATSALRLDDRNADMAVTAAQACVTLMEIDRAAEYARQAIEINPEQQSAYAMLAIALGSQGDPAGSMAALRKALELNPDWPLVHSKLIFALVRSEGHDADDLSAELSCWNQRYSLPVARRKDRPLRQRRPGDKLRVGWVSPDFRVNVVGRCMLPVFQAFDRNRIEHFCYSSAQSPDEQTDEIRQSVENWRDINGVEDDDAAEMIESDRIDILVDLSLHADDNRLLLFARKPAPIQVTYLSYPGSSGLDAMDYRISNPRLDPPGAGLSTYCEKTIMLSGSYLCYRPQGAAGELSPPPLAKNGFPTFGCLGAVDKLSPAALDLWSELLRRFEDSRLILHAHSQVLREKLSRYFAGAGVSPDRIEFVGNQRWPAYIETYNRIDVALDTLACSAGMSACDALLMGVPIVTLIGKTAIQRMCYSMLFDVGHPEWAALSTNQYLDIACSLVADLPRLAELRSNLRSQIEASSLMDASAVARDLERVFAEIATVHR